VTVNELTKEIIGAAIDVHRALGPGLLESTYEACLVYELAQRGLSSERQKALPVKYKGGHIDCGFRIDVLVEGAAVIELKAVGRLEPIHEAQLLSYLRLSGHPIGLLMNLNATRLKAGIRRIVNRLPEQPSASSAPSAVSSFP
jgi:GxxExxY protein